MVKLERLLYLVVIGALVFIGYTFYSSYFIGKSLERSIIKNEGDLSCVSKNLKFKNKDKLMLEQFSEETELMAQFDFYKCNTVQRGDIVQFAFAEDQPPVVRIVRGIPGDRVELIIDENHQAWDIKINGELVPFRKGNYFFGVSTTPPPIQLYLDEHESKLGEGHYIILSAVAPGGIDSSVMGVVERSTIISRVVRVK